MVKWRGKDTYKPGFYETHKTGLTMHALRHGLTGFRAAIAID